MFDELDNIKEYGSIGVIIVSLMMIFVSGIFFGITYYVMDVTETGLETTTCVIQDNVYVDNCQELWSLSVYPFLALREILIWFSYFFIFALVLGMLIAGYQSGKSPILLGFLIVFILIMTYVGVEVSNVYRSMLEVAVFNDMMTPFVVYNKIMLYFPWFIFFTGILSVMLSIVNFQKTYVNKGSDALNY